jgi:uncharacterized membrane protein (DUF485 family)
MTQTQRPPEGRAAVPVNGGPAGEQPAADIDWVAAERSPEFNELVKRKRSFVVPATIFFLAWYSGFVLLCGYAPDFMGSEFLTDGLTVGYVLALSQFIMVWGLSAWYLRKADREFDPLAERAAARAVEASAPGGTTARERRFEREPAATNDSAVTDKGVSPR